MHLPFAYWRTSNTALSRLDRDLAALLDGQLAEIRRSVRRGGSLERSALEAIDAISSARSGVPQLLAAEHRDQVALLEALRNVVVAHLGQASRAPDGRILLARALVALDTTLRDLEAQDARRADQQVSVAIPSLLLRATCLQLLPPERMAVMAGSAITSCHTRATAVFDVTATESASRTHVKADQQKMAAALLAMEATKTRLIAWVHSHPGTGPGATLPSSIDTHQYAEWRKDFPDLVAAVMTQDRYVRFFGEAVRRGVIAVRVEGDGIQRVDEHVYRLA